MLGVGMGGDQFEIPTIAMINEGLTFCFFEHRNPWTLCHAGLVIKPAGLSTNILDPWKPFMRRIHA